ncbi:MAG: hypothetical protein ACI9YM_002292 [Brevundimonas sp.]|jgi:hypothetical protein|uniref:DUF4168 domain-containing protein n=1 Tax=Brevundimonas sp. TaxID=1871086 RepID=UPI0024883B62|nr:DUF4168 domain-containing protein [Brevundimonas sp.]MDI1282584.1 DUF4168 domain-containing protein [Brevundimonas sp.]
MRNTLLVAVSFVALAAAGQSVAAPAFTATAAVTQDASDAISDAELRAFAAAMAEVQTVAAAVEGTPTAEQQASMAASVQGSGLAIDRFNTIATAVSQDPALRARIAVVTAPAPAPGSVAAGVSDQELGQFAAAMGVVQTVAAGIEGGTATAEQQAEMAAAVQNSGLDIERFNAISTAVSQDGSLQARIALINARADGSQ